MRNISFIIILIGSFSAANCQTFKGTVYDRSTDSTISFAVVYISGTSVGTYTDINGNFTLDISRFRSMPITISMLGYYSITLAEHSSNKLHNIYLSQKIKVLNEVVITAKGKRKTYLRIFKREFLGETENALECDILNENELRFTYNSDSNLLRAFSSKPILIHNKALGYTITYYLDKFNFSRKRDKTGVLTETFTLLGNYSFKDDLLTLSESIKWLVEERRKRAYLGSRMHFFRLLYRGNLIQTGEYTILLSDNSAISKGFSIDSKTPINSGSLMIKKDSLSGYIKNEGELTVSYRWKSTIMNVKMGSIYFEKNGYFDPTEVEFSGDMSQQRIADLLPFEYQLK
jgi:hypothetical protein